MPLVALGALAIGGSVAGGAIAAHGAGKAADAQVNAANAAANLQHQDAQAALDQNNAQFKTQQNNIAPWLTTGRSANANLAYQLGILPKDATIPGTGTPGTAATPGYWTGGSTDGVPWTRLTGSDSRNRFALDNGFDNGTGQWVEGTPGTPGTPGVSMSSLVNPNLGAEGSLAQDFTEKFQAPTNITEQNDPGYQERLKLGQDAIERSAAARGNLLTGGTAKDLNDWTQSTASDEYSNVYNRAFNEYATRHNVFKQNQADRFNRLSAVSGTGQVAANQLGQLGAQQSANNTNILLTSGQQIGQNINNAGAARASGYAAGANAYGSALGGIGNNLTSLYYLSKMFPGTTPAAAPAYAPI